MKIILEKTILMILIIILGILIITYYNCAKIDRFIETKRTIEYQICYNDINFIDSTPLIATIVKENKAIGSLYEKIEYPMTKVKCLRRLNNVSTADLREMEEDMQKIKQEMGE